MAGLKELAYVVYEVSDLNEWENFGVNMLGMEVGERTSNTLTLRNDALAHRWVLKQGTADDLAASGYEYDSNEGLDVAVAKLRADGFEVEDATATLAKERKVERIFVTHDPMGNRAELVTRFSCEPVPEFKSQAIPSGFLTGVCGAGHQFILTKNISQAEAMNFYHTLLGFRVSDRIVQEIAPGIIADAMFLHCNPRHHTLALGEIPMPKRTHHFMLQVNAFQDLGFTYDRCIRAGVPLIMTIGSHPNDQMLSFYVESPSGFAVEYGWGGLTIDDDTTWPYRVYDKLDSWGHFDPKAEIELLTRGLTKRTM